MILKQAMLHLENGEVVQKDIRIENGKIAEIGNGLSGGEVRDLSGRHVYPGRIALHQTNICEAAKMLEPQLDAWYLLGASGVCGEDYFRNGVTSVLAVPGDTAILGGSCAVVKAGCPLKRGTLRRDAALKGSFSEDVINQKPVAREAGATVRYGTRAAAPRTPQKMARLLHDALHGNAALGQRGSELLQRALSGEIPLVIHCHRGTEAVRALSICEEYPKLRLILEGVPAEEQAEAVYAGKKAEFFSDLCHDSEACAALLGVADRIGRLREGLDADLVICEDADEKKILETMVNGETVYRA